MASRKGVKKSPEKKREKKVIEAIQRGGEGRLSHDLAAKYSRLGVSFLSDESPKKLDPTLRKEMETFLSFDPSEVRVHTGENAQISAEAMGAKAFAVGERDIFFAKGEFEPATTPGKALIAHEITHLADTEFGLKRLHRKPSEEEFEIKA
ncbi:MAG: DUF4157 domain-containing protein, partial [Deltaproteobacteria bacterium]|nr:DUF4157 domain-containing protein [Deltaproteobacteria bacterium]